MFIHGLFVNPLTWIPWIEFFKAKGYSCHAPAYPFHQGDPAELRKNIDPGLNALTFQHVIESLSLYIEKLPEKPILIGHSMGGLVVQKLIEMDKGVAGICIDGAPPKGIFILKWSFFRSTAPVINPFKGNSFYLATVKWFNYACCDEQTMDQTQLEYDKFIVPESRNIPRSILGKDGKIDFYKPHVPLLFIAGEKDRIVPSLLNRKNFNAYTDKNSKKDFKEFAGRRHHICRQQNWEEVAEFVDNWLDAL